MTQQEMEAKIDKLEKQVIYLASVVSVLGAGFLIYNGEPVPEIEKQFILKVNKAMIDKGITKEMIMELFT